MRPNPWFFVPVLVGLVVGGALGWMIATVSCGAAGLDGATADRSSGSVGGESPDERGEDGTSADGGCPISQWVTAVVVGVVVAGGVGVVAVLAIRSMDEHRARTNRGELSVDDDPGG